MSTSSKHREPNGFSLIELLIVVAILMCIAALALPTMWNVISSSRSKSAMGEVIGVIQDTRSNAVRRNKTKTVHFSETGGRTWVTSTDAIAGEGAQPDKALALPQGMAMVTSPSGDGAPATLDAEAMWGGGTDPVSTEPSFSPRGIPCSFSDSTKKCNAVAGFVYYFSINGRWSAVGISPAGRISAFYWNGSEWRK
ncbi:MAG TPA: prepilin-type N-terminal cleavage/methylation domain-containing protein [Terriglobales bacterium]|nr:prepilin-type N-terminal cleavage/methylation domain-containing protein [Terriglobales bacterium]